MKTSPSRFLAAVFFLGLSCWELKASAFLDIPAVCNGRLTLTSGTAVTISDVASSASVYFTPYMGSRVSLYDGSEWDLYSFTERTLSLGTLTADTNYDVFLYNNSGTLTLALSAAWSNATTRLDALATQDGIYVKSGSPGYRYLGTIHTLTTTTTTDSTFQRYVWNYYNRVPRRLYKGGSGSGYTYSTNTWRSANADNAYRIEVVVGIPEVAIVLNAIALSQNSAGAAHNIGVCKSCTNGADFYTYSSATSSNRQTLDVYDSPFGYVYYQGMERGAASGTTTWYHSGHGIILGRIDG